MDCTILNCGRPAFARGVCRRHYDEQVRAEAPQCSEPGCDKPGTRTGGICDKHYRVRLGNTAPQCSIPGCSGPVKAHGLCQKHYQRLRAHGDPSNARPRDWGSREAHPLYKTYIWHRRGVPKSMCAEWAADFWAFVDVVVDKPEGCTLRRKDKNKPIGPDNWEWKVSTPSADGAAYARKWRANNKRADKNINLKKLYSLTIDGYEALEEAQKHVCAICKRPPSGRYSNLAVDHCHDTGKVRGLLCDSCNRALGLFKDDPAILFSAGEYLRKHKD